MEKIIIIGMAVILTIAGIIAINSDDTMSQCEKTHSHDVCLQELQ